MFARRAAWDLSPNALSQLLSARRAAGLPVLDLSDSNPTQCGIDAPGEALRGALARVATDPASLRYVPDARGEPGVREAIATYHARGRALPTLEHVVLTAGTSDGYAHLFRLLANPGDRVHLPTPGYPLFAHLAELEGLEVRSYPLRPPARGSNECWRIDLDALAAELSPQSRAIVAIDPHNPTGSFVDVRDLASLESIATEYGLALICDEVFADYTLGDGAAAPPARFEFADSALRFVLSGASKVLGLPQLKLAWIVAAGPATLRDEALARLEFAVDAFLSVSPVLARALPALFAEREPLQAALRARVALNRHQLARAARAVREFELLPSQAGWFGILRVRGAGSDDEALATLLLDRTGVLVAPGFLFDLEARDSDGAPCAHLVLSLLPEPALFARGLDAICALAPQLVGAERAPLSTR